MHIKPYEQFIITLAFVVYKALYLVYLANMATVKKVVSLENGKCKSRYRVTCEVFV